MGYVLKNVVFSIVIMLNVAGLYSRTHWFRSMSKVIFICISFDGSSDTTWRERSTFREKNLSIFYRPLMIFLRLPLEVSSLTSIITLSIKSKLWGFGWRPIREKKRGKRNKVDCLLGWRHRKLAVVIYPWLKLVAVGQICRDQASCGLPWLSHADTIVADSLIR